MAGSSTARTVPLLTENINHAANSVQSDNTALVDKKDMSDNAGRPLVGNSEVPVVQTTPFVERENDEAERQQPRQALATDVTPAEVAAVVAFNFFASTGIVSANKHVFNMGFTFATTLTCFHFVATFIGLLILARLNLFVPKKLDLRKSAKLALAGMGFVVFSNLSLQYNSVGFYQVMKHMVCICFPDLPRKLGIEGASTPRFGSANVC